MSRPLLPQYNSDEVEDFHPVFEYVLNRLIQDGTIDAERYEVRHHYNIGRVIPDYVILDTFTNRIKLVCEIKKTPASVYSTRFRLQAQSYITESREQTPYYLLSNLEITQLFRYSQDRPVDCQIVRDGTWVSGKFNDNNDDVFYNNLYEHMRTAWSFVLESVTEYDTWLPMFHQLLSNLSTNDWHETLAPCLWEYIAGAFRSNETLSNIAEGCGWNHASDFSNNFQHARIISDHIDFHKIFEDPIPRSLDDAQLGLLPSFYNSGKSISTGDDLAGTIYNLLDEPDIGIVQTDMELAIVLAKISSFFIGAREDIVVCDPAAGAGNLLSAAIREIYPRPKNVYANELEEKFKEILSLRLGLSYLHELSYDNQPNVTSGCITQNTRMLEHADLVLINPPYVAGIRSVQSRGVIAAQINQQNGRPLIANRGQLGLEAYFLELIVACIREGTCLSVIFPLSYLNSLSDEMASFRNFLIEHLGLRFVFLYPQESVFRSVQKATMILVGTKGYRGDVTFVKNRQNIADIDLRGMNCLEDFIQNTPCSNQTITRASLRDLNSEGWNIFVQSPILEIFEGLDIEFNLSDNFIYRGRGGNNGASDLIFLKQSLYGDDYNFFLRDSVLALRNSRDLPVGDLTLESFQGRALPDNRRILDDDRLISVIDRFRSFLISQNQSRNQTRAVKSRDELFQIINNDVNISIAPPFSVLVPRNSRRFRSVSRTLVPTFVSTNFIIIECQDEAESLIYASWLKSIFGQVQLEFNGKNQEGARKIEKAQVERVVFPQLQLETEILSNLREEFNSCPFIDVQNFNISALDNVWKDILEISNNDYRQLKIKYVQKIAEL